jgi:hypothetical protein
LVDVDVLNVVNDEDSNSVENVIFSLVSSTKSVEVNVKGSLVKKSCVVSNVESSLVDEFSVSSVDKIGVDLVNVDVE